MNTQDEIQIKSETLNSVLSKMLGESILHSEYKTKQLQGGTLGDVRLVTGTAETTDGKIMPYHIVLKKQKKWERYSDPNSWQREYDLYISNFGKLFTGKLRLPECYHTEINGDEIQIWIEYIEGATGLSLTGEMYERAAKELGRFQGSLYADQSPILQTLTNLSTVDYMKNLYLHYRSWNEVYDYIRSTDCPIPKHLCDMLIDIDKHADEIFNRIEKLPIVLCHRDFWVTNIFSHDDKILLIDWDTAGWGYMGEDIASFIADESDVDHMVEYYHRCVRAYYKGFSEYADISQSSDSCIYEMILLKFGYRLVEDYKFTESSHDKIQFLTILQKIYEMKK
ncbi:MAG: aminoglycoside phosphotransferase family protein [Mobilitalea sp.]